MVVFGGAFLGECGDFACVGDDGQVVGGGVGREGGREGGRKGGVFVLKVGVRRE